jgi:hypothetical protein
MVLDRPEISLHTKGSENDSRCHVTRRKLSGGTRSDLGRDCRDAFLRPRQNMRQTQNRFLGLSGTIWAIDAPSQAPKPFRTRHKSSSQQRNRPDRHEFCPSCYVLLSSIAAEPSRNVSLWAQSFRHLVRPLRQLSGSELPLTPFAAGGPQLAKCPCLR